MSAFLPTHPVESSVYMKGGSISSVLGLAQLGADQAIVRQERSDVYELVVNSFVIPLLLRI